MESQLDRDSSVPYYLQIDEQLREHIESGKIAPFSQAPSEANLMEMFGVSRMTARKAVDRLVSDGFLYRRHGKGTFVAPHRITHPATTETSFSAAVERLGLPLETRVLAASLVPPLAHVARELRIGPRDRVVYISRLRIVDGKPVAIHTTYLPAQFSRVLDHDLAGSLLKAIAAEGGKITSITDSLQAVAAGFDEASLLQVSPNTPLMRMESVGYNSAMEPVRYTESLYRGDHFRFTAEARVGGEIRLEFKDATAPPRVGEEAASSSSDAVARGR